MAPQPVEFLFYPGFKLSPHQAVIAQGIAGVAYREDIVWPKTGDGQQGGIDATAMGGGPVLAIEMQDGGIVAGGKDVARGAAPDTVDAQFPGDDAQAQLVALYMQDGSAVACSNERVIAHRPDVAQGAVGLALAQLLPGATILLPCILGQWVDRGFP